MQRIAKRSGTLCFSSQDLDSSKPAGSVKIGIETIAHDLQRYTGQIIGRKEAEMASDCPLLGAPTAAASPSPP